MFELFHFQSSMSFYFYLTVSFFPSPTQVLAVGVSTSLATVMERGPFSKAVKAVLMRAHCMPHNDRDKCPTLSAMTETSLPVFGTGNPSSVCQTF